jgi:hypothetical protein
MVRINDSLRKDDFYNAPFLSLNIFRYKTDIRKGKEVSKKGVLKD